MDIMVNFVVLVVVCNNAFLILVNFPLKDEAGDIFLLLSINSMKRIRVRVKTKSLLVYLLMLSDSPYLSV